MPIEAPDQSRSEGSDDRRAVLSGIKRVSRPGLRVYVNKREIPRVFGGLGVAIMSTSHGVISGREAADRALAAEPAPWVPSD